MLEKKLLTLFGLGVGEGRGIARGLYHSTVVMDVQETIILLPPNAFDIHGTRNPAQN